MLNPNECEPRNPDFYPDDREAIGSIICAGCGKDYPENKGSFTLCNACIVALNGFEKAFGHSVLDSREIMEAI